MPYTLIIDYSLFFKMESYAIQIRFVILIVLTGVIAIRTSKHETLLKGISKTS